MDSAPWRLWRVAGSLILQVQDPNNLNGDPASMIPHKLLYAIPVRGGAPHELMRVPEGQLATDGRDAIYVTQRGDAAAIDLRGSGRKLDHLGYRASAPIWLDHGVVVAVQPTDDVPCCTVVHVALADGAVTKLATNSFSDTDTGLIVGASQGSGAVVVDQLTGTALRIGATGVAEPVNGLPTWVACVATTGSRLWWVRVPSPDEYRKLPPHGAITITSRASGGSANVVSTFDDDVNNYVACGATTDQFIYTHGKQILAVGATGAPRVIVRTAHSIGALLVDGDRVFWSEAANDKQWAIRVAPIPPLQ